MKRSLSALLAFLIILFSAGAVLADPLVLDSDLTDTLIVLYDPDNPSAGSYTYTYRYPHVAEDEPDAGKINPFYADQVYTLETNIHFMADGYIDSGENVTVDVSYEITCNNDRFFSVLVRKDSVISGFVRTVFFMHDLILPRDAGPQSRVGSRIEGINALEKGDLVFFGRKNADGTARVSHVGIYIGDGRFIHSLGLVKIGSFCKDDPLYDSYNTGRYLFAVRILSYLDATEVSTTVTNPLYNL